MNDFEQLNDLMRAMGVETDVEEDAQGWGLPAYRHGDMDFPPTVMALNLGYTHLYFNKDTGRYIGWWNHESSRWHPRNNAPALGCSCGLSGRVG
jgi:hypothetical protein